MGDSKRKTSKRKSNSKELWTTVSLLKEERDGIEEDSGLGDSVPFADEESCSQSQNCNLSQKSLIKHGTPFTLSTYEKMHAYPEPKRLRLDLPEEANELPEEKYSVGNQITPLLSFKNVPALLSPLKTIQEHGLELRTNASFSMQPLSIKRIAPSEASMAVKEDKLAKKCANRHFLDRIYPSSSRDGIAELKLLTQPEQQHRARYQTEGSRGAVKDRSGLEHPIIKLNGYNKPAVLLTYVACDGGSVAPHMFYQAYKVSGKNSTPCKEEKVQGTTILQMDLLPEKEMSISCDCVGLLKERNVDVEQRLKGLMHRGRRKSTKCRLVFRTTITMDSGKEETLQIVSEPICCTQPPGVPEISRKSLEFSPHEGGQELFIIGKNFFKDTKISFEDVRDNEESSPWKVSVIPDKDFLHQTHLICTVPPYIDGTLKEVEVQISVTSCGKTSEAIPFKYQSPCTDERVNTSSPDGTQNSSLQRLPREQAIVHPLQIQSSLPPQVMYASEGTQNTSPSKVCVRKIITSTATEHSPVSTINLKDIKDSTKSLDQQKAAEPRKIAQSNQSVIENLVDMLKLAKNTQILSTQPEFVHIIANEILNQLKGKNSHTVRKPEQNEPMPESSNFNNVSNLAYREEGKNEKYHVSTDVLYVPRSTSVVQHYNVPVKQSVVSSNGFPLPSSVNAVLVRNSIDPKISEVKGQSYIMNAQNCSLPILNVETCNSKIAENVQPSISVNAEYVQRVPISTPMKINPTPVTVSCQKLLTNQTFVTKERFNNQNSFETVNSLYLNQNHNQQKSVQNNTTLLQTSERTLPEVSISQPQLFQSLSNVNENGQTTESNLPVVSLSQTELYQSLSNVNQTALEIKVVESNNSKISTHSNTLYNHSEMQPVYLHQKPEHNNTTVIQTSESSLSPVVSLAQPELYPSLSNVNQTIHSSLEHNGETSNSKITAQNTTLYNSYVNMPVHTASSLNTELNVARNILQNQTLTSSSLSLTDPLLSQTTSSSEIYAPQQSHQLGSNCGNAQISNVTSINSTISTDVTKRFEQLSESELINYINPTCFDNV